MHSAPSSPHPSEESMITVQLGDREISISRNTPVGEVLRAHYTAGSQPVLAAIVHNRCVDLSHPVGSPTTIVPVDYTMREGVMAYRRTASLILLEAARRVFPGVRVTIGQALGNGYHYHPRLPDPFTRHDMARLDEMMRELVAQDLPLQTEVVSRDEALDIFQTLGDASTERLLQTYWEPFVSLVRCGGFCDIHHYPVAPSTGLVRSFELLHSPPGLVLRFPPRGAPQPIRSYRETPKLFAAYRETRRWNEILGVENVGQLNALTIGGKAGDIIRVAEGLHEKKIAEIADRVAHQDRPVRLVLVSGPSASGKTTFAKRLSLQLRVNGLRPVALSTDNFYVDREDTPLDGDGKYDFEAIEAIDLELFNQTLLGLMNGREVRTPKFNFVTGLRSPEESWNSMRLERDQVLLVEGIHGLNPRLTEAVPDALKYKVYVSAMTQLCIDDHNRIFTSDTRFLRRIVRDRMFRGYSATTTIENWPSVRRGELRNIFPFQEQADVMFNSALVYEQAVLRLFAERFLLEVPQDHPSFVDAYRLLAFVHTFVPMFKETVPQISLLQEFLGDSAFKY